MLQTPIPPATHATQDFDELVRQFILAHGGVFTDEFLGRLPHELLELRDDLEANRGLLMVRGGEDGGEGRRGGRRGERGRRRVGRRWEDGGEDGGVG